MSTMVSRNISSGLILTSPLQAPLDWLDPSDELRASIAVIRYNATDKKNYKGPVFINPGAFLS